MGVLFRKRPLGPQTASVDGAAPLWALPGPLPTMQFGARSPFAKQSPGGVASVRVRAGDPPSVPVREAPLPGRTFFSHHSGTS